MATPQPETDISIRPLREDELGEASRIVRLAFATFLGLPPEDPRRPSDSDYVRSRWIANRDAVLAAEHVGKLIGTNFATSWGSFGFFGPLTVEPEYWNRGVAQMLLAPTMQMFRGWGCRHLGLYTFAQSAKHISLYQKYGFWPRDLVAVMAKEISIEPSAEGHKFGFKSERLSSAKSGGLDFAEVLTDCAKITSAIFDGLNLEQEIRAVDRQKLGDTVLVTDRDGIAAFGVCHSGPGTEAGSGVCYVKFAAVRPDSGAADAFDALLDGVENYARQLGVAKITAGVNLARREAFQALRDRGFRTEMQGMAMETGDARSGYNRAGIYVLDDWR
jgi:GNAT superfamily N-acetyltransferase